MSKTQLKTRKIHGRDYVEVNERLKYFRQSFPGFRIRTEIVSMANDEIVMSASVLDSNGETVSVGHAHEEKASSRINQTSYVENCETSAIGRALGILGIGLDGGVATAEEVELAVAKQNANQDQVDDDRSDRVAVIHELFGDDDIQKINAYLRSINWCDGATGLFDLPDDKLDYCIQNPDALLKAADTFALKSDGNVRSAVAKSVAKGGVR